ncbi:MAG TPA: hypothetical protein DCO65_01595, partial [Spartobacteria bacterium]|nr:hypothetical protein [Spartobacteria bacterium]
MLLPEMQERQGRAASSVRWIMADRLIHFPLQLGGNACARRVHEREKLVGQRALFVRNLVVFE